jgi:hypothetical protein
MSKSPKTPPPKLTQHTAETATATPVNPVHEHFANHAGQLSAILTLIEDEGARDAAWESLGGRPSERAQTGTGEHDADYDTRAVQEGERT